MGEDKQIPSHLPQVGSSIPQEMVSVRVGLEQLERLVSLKALTPEQAQAGRQAGGLEVRIPAQLVEEFRQSQFDPDKAELEKVARRIDQAGLSGPARLFLASNRPLSFFGSQLLLLAQPFSKMAFGPQDPAGRYSRLLEDRQNVDWLMARLDVLSAERRAAARRTKKPAAKHRG